MKRNNLKIFGISKTRNLSDFVTTEQDVRKGTSRVPLNLARIYEEDILSDEEVRQGLKTFSDWPTFPQLYVKGEFQGGLDIVNELAAEPGGLKAQFQSL